jgi:hypothetical protein
MNPARGPLNKETSKVIKFLRESQRFFVGKYDAMPGSTDLGGFGAFRATMTRVK